LQKWALISQDLKQGAVLAWSTKMWGEMAYILKSRQLQQGQFGTTFSLSQK
jgi:hypothetical protein